MKATEIIFKRSFQYSVNHEVKGGAGGYYFVANIVNLHDQTADQSVLFALQYLVKSPQNNLMTNKEQQMHRELGTDIQQELWVCLSSAPG